MNYQQKLNQEIDSIKRYYNLEPTIEHEGEDISISYRVGLSEAAEVTLRLVYAGDDDSEGQKVYDLDIQVGNDDSVGPIYMNAALQLCIEDFYTRGLHKQFGRIVGDR